jgi:hypothetical protein
MRRSLIVVSLVLLAVGVTQLSAADICGIGVNWTPVSAAAYLANPSQGKSDACTARALDLLAEPGASPDTALLIDYIGFVRPGLTGMHVLTIESVQEFFPAVRALVLVGSGSLPDLVGLLVSPLEDTPRRNAVRAIKLIFGSDSVAAIRYILDESKKTGGEARHRLGDVAELLYLWCSEEEMSACREVFEADVLALPH